jgi:hypothetical protein
MSADLRGASSDFGGAQRILGDKLPGVVDTVRGEGHVTSERGERDTIGKVHAFPERHECHRPVGRTCIQVDESQAPGDGAGDRALATPRGPVYGY